MGSLLEKNSESVRKRIAAHSFDDEEGEEYEGSKFGGFPEYFRRKKIKLQNLDAEIRTSSANPQIFRGIVANVNGYTQPSLNDLHHLIVSHGGGFLQYLDGKTTVTHIIASSLTPKKAIEFRRYRIVKPAWVVDSVKAGKLLPWNNYRALDEGVNQRLLGFDGGNVVSQANTQQPGYRDQTDTSWFTNQVKKVVDDIDDEEGVHFPSSQAVAYNGRGSGFKRVPFDEESKERISPPETKKPQQVEEFVNSSGSFEVTSSLKHLLDQAPAHDKALVSPGSSIPLPEVQEKSITPQQNKQRSPSIVQGYADLYQRDNESLSPSPSKTTKPMTAEEHNALLLADPRIRKSSTANPDFLRQYYSESRLHHLSTWKADLKLRFQQMAAEKTASQKLPVKRKPGARRYIMHVDFDSFFCAVSLKSAPEYVDKPAVVAHGTGTGSEIASCNYPARAFGVKNGMWMKKALELCSDIKVLPYDFPAYEKASEGFYEAILDVGGIVQSVSVDEALIDVTSLCLPAGGSDGIGIREGSIWHEQEKANQIGQDLRKRIYEKTGCAVSVGIGGNILLAKVALRKAKPAGQYQIKPEEVLDFLGELSVQDLPGVAYSIGGKLEEIGVKFVKDVRQQSKDRLMTVLGPKTGEKIWDYSRGIDRTEVGEQNIRKSVSAEVNWGIRFISQPEAEEFVQNMCIELQRRLIDQRVKGRQLTVKIMRKAADAPIDPPKHLGHGKCDTFNKSVVFGVATNDAAVIGREAVSILRGYGFSPGELRGLGVQMAKLELLKPTTAPDGSQRKINFGAAPPKSPKISDDIVDDEDRTPKKSWVTPGTFSAANKQGILDPILETTPSKSRILTNQLIDAAETSSDDVIDAATPPKRRDSFSYRQTADFDPIDESSPLKPKATPVHPAMAIAKANAGDASAKKLNLRGNQFLSAKKQNVSSTQFVIPTQIDPEVLKELPQDIRSRLLAQSKSKPKPKPKPKDEYAAVVIQDRSRNISESRDEQESNLGDRRGSTITSRRNSAAQDSAPASPIQGHSTAIPSQLDPEVFEALPEDMKAEILASYSHSHAPERGAQTVLPQSPRKNRIIAAPKKKLMTPPKKRGRGRPSREEMRLKREKEASSTFTQSNFVAGKRKNPVGNDEAVESDGNTSDTLDPEFLSALPEDVRQEILIEHRRKRLAKRGGLVTAAVKKKRPPANDIPLGPRRLRLPPREPKPTFTTQELSSLPELRDTISAWFKEFEEEGPHPDDVGAMERYLRRVILDEKDMGKVVSVVKWLEFVVKDSETRAWDEALEGIKEKVQSAVQERGLGRLEL